MSKIEYKTRGNSSPQGKPRVFVFYHQEDAVGKGGNQSSFDLVCADILAAQNCAIYYESDWSRPTDEEDLISSLSEMQLLVMVISTNFLFRNAPQTIRTIYNIAKTNHTPILPIAVEYGIEQVFAEQMNSILSGAGDIQFLDRTANDPTKIPYKEQLEKYLNSVIVGDELASRVRAAFDAYIFMSYRKKDRYYAQQLMRVIHNIPFCRDIAIWYDEYLVPGESWSDAIKEAMIKSRLVTLAVTPSLAEPNYIATHEYPYAKELHKDIVPAEMQKTDKTLLEDLFKDLPAFVDGTNIQAMTERLKQLAITTNDESPEHNFLIGLAYLNAIDVERDTERALKLIRSAAKAKLPEAIKKLVDMYNTGEGVQRDHNVAIKWQKKYISTIKKVGYSPKDIVVALLDLEDMEEAVGDLLAAMECGIECLELQRQMMKDADDDDWKLIESLRFAPITYGKLGQIESSFGNLDLAEKFYLEGLQLAEKIFYKTGAPEAMQNILSLYDKLGDMYIKENNWGAAKFYYGKSFFNRKRIAEKNPTIENRRNLSISTFKMGDLAQEGGDLSFAKQYYSQSLQVDRQIAEETPTIDAKRNLSICYERLGDIAQAENDLSVAKDYYTQSMEIRDNIVDDCPSLSTWRDLSIINNRLGDVAYLEGNRNKAKEYFECCYKIDTMLTKKSQSLESKRAFVTTCKKLGDISKEEDNYKEAKLYYEMGKITDLYLLDTIGTDEARHDLIVSYNNLGEIAQKQGDLTTANDYFMKSLQLLQQMNEKDTKEIWQGLSECYFNLGSVAEDAGNLQSAKNYYKQSLQQSKWIMNENCTYHSLCFIALDYFHLGQIEQKEEHFASAKEYFQKALKLFEPMAEKGVKTAAFQSAMCYNHLADISREEKDNVSADEYSFKFMDILSTL